MNAEWEAYLEIARKIKRLSPDFIFSTVVGDGTALLHRAYREVGLDPARMPIGSLTTCEAEVQQMGADTRRRSHHFGRRTSSRWPPSCNARCVRKCKQRFGADVVTNMCWEAAYFQTHLVANALRKARTDSVRELLRVLPGSEFLAPQGLVRIDEHNHHTYLRPRIGRVNAQGQFDILEEADQLGAPRSVPRRPHPAGLVVAGPPAGPARG